MQCVEIVSPLLKMDNHIVIIKLIFVLQPTPRSPWTLNRQIMYFHHVLYLSNVYFPSNIERIISLQYVFTCTRFNSKYWLEKLFPWTVGILTEWWAKSYFVWCNYFLNRYTIVPFLSPSFYCLASTQCNISRV